MAIPANIFTAMDTYRFIVDSQCAAGIDSVEHPWSLSLLQITRRTICNDAVFDARASIARLSTFSCKAVYAGLLIAFGGGATRVGLRESDFGRLRPKYRNHLWSWDFVMARTEDGRAITILTLIDEYTRE